MVMIGMSGVYEVVSFRPKVFLKDGECLGVAIEAIDTRGEKIEEAFHCCVKTNMKENQIVALANELVKKSIIEEGVLSFSANDILELVNILKGEER